jgi:hypothetical protein
VREQREALVTYEERGMTEEPREAGGRERGSLSPTMATEAFRDEAGRLLDQCLSRWVLTDPERQLLKALRTHVRTADEAEVKKVVGLL